MKPVRLPSLKVLAANLGCTGRGVSQCERVPQSTPYDMRCMFQSSRKPPLPCRPRAPTSVAWIPPPTRAGRRHRGTHTWMAFSVEHTFDIVNVSRMIVCPRLLLLHPLRR